MRPNTIAEMRGSALVGLAPSSRLDVPMQSSRLPPMKRVTTAGLILRNHDRFVFQVGLTGQRDALGIVRLGGHVEAGETPAECAVREALEEGSTRASIVSPPGTFRYDADSEAVLSPSGWPGEAPASLLLATMSGASAGDLSVTYLAESTDDPSPSAETQGLIFLSAGDVLWLTSTQVSLAEFIDAEGTVVAATELPPSMTLRPHGQLRALAVLVSGNVL